MVMLPLNLFSYQSDLVLGTTKYLQLACPQQKQPFTKMMVLGLWITMSGLPGKFFVECPPWTVTPPSTKSLVLRQFDNAPYIFALVVPPVCRLISTGLFFFQEP